MVDHLKHDAHEVDRKTYNKYPAGSLYGGRRVIEKSYWGRSAKRVEYYLFTEKAKSRLAQNA